MRFKVPGRFIRFQFLFYKFNNFKLSYDLSISMFLDISKQSNSIFLFLKADTANNLLSEFNLHIY